MNLSKNISKGFTLIEYLIIVMIISIVFVVASNFFGSTLNSHKNDQHILQNSNKSVSIVQAISDEIKYAESFSCPNYPTSTNIFTYTHTSKNGTIYTTYNSRIYLNPSDHMVYRDDTDSSGTTTSTLLARALVSGLSFTSINSTINVTMEVYDRQNGSVSPTPTPVYMQISTSVRLLNSTPTPSPTPGAAGSGTPTPH